METTVTIVVIRNDGEDGDKNEVVIVETTKTPKNNKDNNIMAKKTIYEHHDSSTYIQSNKYQFSHKAYTYCVRKRNNCVLEDLIDKNFTTVDVKSTTVKSDSVFDEKVPQQQPKILLLPVVPALFCNVYREGQVFN